MNKPIFSGLSITEIRNTVMYEVWYDYIKPKYQDKANPCYMHIDSFIANKKTEGIYKHIVNDVEKRFGSSDYEVKRALATDKNKK